MTAGADPSRKDDRRDAPPRSNPLDWRRPSAGAGRTSSPPRRSAIAPMRAGGPDPSAEGSDGRRLRMDHAHEPRDGDVLAERLASLPGRPRRCRGDRRRHRGGVPLVGAGALRTAAARPSRRPRSRARSRGAGVASCAPARTSRRGPRGGARREGLDRRARRRLPDGVRALAPQAGARRPEGGRGRRRDVHERVDRPRVRGRARRGAGHAESRLHRPDHGEAGPRRKDSPLRPWRSRTRWRAWSRPWSACSTRRLGRMSCPRQRPRRLRRTPALRDLVRETTLARRRPHRAAVREGGHRRCA